MIIGITHTQRLGMKALFQYPRSQYHATIQVRSCLPLGPVLPVFLLAINATQEVRVW